ncbi:MAG: TetR/AcrR family transcriptional regulator [Bacteroidia bacterium]
MAQKKKIKETSEEKIVEAARKLFTEKGYDAVKTRDIAEEAGINLALLNYYFRSKEKLFEIIMKENFTRFMNIISEVVNNEKTTLWEKIEELVASYIDMLSANPDMPLFVLSHAKQDPQRMKMRERFLDSYFLKQMHQAVKSGEIMPINPVDFILNIVALTIFPFVGRRMMVSNNSIMKEQFNELMLHRKKMIPKWIEAMLKVK